MTNEVTLRLPEPEAALGYIERLLVTGKVSPDMLAWLADIKQQILSATVDGILDDFDLHHNRVALPTPEQEVEFLDRIVSGLPVDRTPFIVEEYMEEKGEEIKLYDVASLYPTEYALRDVTVVDVVSAYPKLTDEQMANALKEAAEMWTRIPDFDNYEVNALGDIRSRWTKRMIEVAHQGGEKYVNMHDKDGYAHDVNVRYVVEKVFGK